MYELTRGFSRQHRITEFPTTGMHQVSPERDTDLPMSQATLLHQHHHRLAQLPSCVTPSLGYYQIRSRASPSRGLKDRPDGSGRLVSLIHHGRAHTGTGISTRCPSTTPVGLALGPDSPWEDELDPGTLSHPADRILTYQFVTHACILTRTQSTPPYGNASTHARRSPTQTKCLPRLRRCT